VYSLGKLAYWMFAGTIFDREKLRAERFDLTKKEPRVAHGLLYQLLEKMILETPEDRLPDGNAAGELAEKIAERMAMNAHVLDLTAPQPCHYCAAGNYEVRVNPRWWYGWLGPGRQDTRPGEAFEHARNQCQQYGIPANPASPWLVLQCGYCGNVQAFQLFHTDEPRKNWGITP